MTVSKHHDALVVGTGFGGLYELYLLKQLGLDVVAIDSATDVGGTWHWNRYPGARSDVDSQTYRYSWDKELLQTSKWSHNYLTQPELEEYFQGIARKHDLYPHIRFETELKHANWNDQKNVWEVGTSAGDEFTVRYLVTAIGILHRKNIPQVPGLETFKGRVVHSSSWKPDVEWEGKRIGVIGSGASGVQLVGALAEHAKSLEHFIRHPQYVLPAALRPVSPEERKAINENYDKLWHSVFASSLGFGFPEPNRPVFSVSAKDREHIFQDLWDEGSGFRFMFGGFSDLATDEAANKEAINFIHRKIKEIVKDPETAEVLLSKDWFARRPLTDDKYYYRFNQENVSAVDLKKTPITSIESGGIKTSDGKLHELDLIVFATGFNATDGSYFAIDIKGRDGLSLRDHWSEAPRTHLGAATSKFPNLFFVNGPGAAFANNAPVTETGASFAADLIARAEEYRKEGKGNGVIESTKEADEQWFETITTVANQTLFSKTPSWFFGENVEGGAVAPRFFFGGIGRLRAAIAHEQEQGYPGFQFS
ncbi:cyclohexanone monooxygenase, variant 1 [Aaosphaeria arxii CBS 175.79]|uniref:Cyclohexanone monooxygenase, variant 1 n=1 Tax=Aaosphaeria arxii CBS 175.79 TaxID=1450172 RepID=A0A6A5Y9M2_9PLEO|nr:cyclohexanone monooxygenase, variant 1 [Aaosphaeria arxii CBS 175.79]KAF2021451.1 cyclohexanone monooxygenase, variant 1 [Aaosphaeria arxii CBS 175.79]